ncbi:MAG: acetylornithine/succinylornithine family transaminase [Clostridiaceae bacterium]
MSQREEDERYILPVYGRLHPEIVRGEGMYLYDATGKKYLDFYSGIAVNTLGHGHPKIMAALSKQMGAYLHLSNYFTSETSVRLAKRLVEASFASKVYFANSGTEANEAMIKLARKYGVAKNPAKHDFVAIDGGFHGRTLGGLSMTGNLKYKTQFGPLLTGVTHIPQNDLDALEAAVTDATCGIILEIIQGEGGVRAITPEFAEKIKELARRHDALILVDEVQTGLMRTGKLFAYEHYDLTPDVVTLAKGLGGGLPLGAMLVGATVADTLLKGEHGSTFGGNPMACAAGDAVLEVITQPDFAEQVHQMSNLLVTGLRTLSGKYPDKIGEVRSYGLMIGVDVGEKALDLRDVAQGKGLLLNITAGTVLRLLPALILTQGDVELFLELLGASLEEV